MRARFFSSGSLLDGDVDRAHHARQQRGGLDGLGALPLEGIAERVDLVHHEVDGAARTGTHAADRIVALAERAEQVRKVDLANGDEPDFVFSAAPASPTT